MATRSSVLAWRMPWTQEPGRLQSMGWRESDTTERLNHQHHLLTKSSREGGQASLSCCLPWCSPCLSVWSCLLKRGLVPSWVLCPPALRTSQRPQLQTPSLGASAHRCGGGWKRGLGFPDDSAVRTLPAAQETQETRGVGQKVQKLSLGREDPLEEGVATHCSVLAWRTPWTEEPGGPQSAGSQRVGHDNAPGAPWAPVLSLRLRSVSQAVRLPAQHRPVPGPQGGGPGAWQPPGTHLDVSAEHAVQAPSGRGQVSAWELSGCPVQGCSRKVAVLARQ